jgi:hypothetical protein
VGKILGGIGPSNLLKENVENLFLEGCQEALQVCTQVDKFYGRTLSHFVDCIRKNGWSISSRENHRITVSRWISLGVQGDTVDIPIVFKA